MRRAEVPPELVGRPFTIQEGRRHGLSDRQFENKVWTTIFRGVRVSAGTPLTPELLVQALKLIVPCEVVATRWAAAMFHGVDVRPRLGAKPEMTVQRTDSIRTRGRVKVRQALLPAEDVMEIDGVLVTTPLRTTFDLARQCDRVESVVGVDAMTHAGLVTLEGLADYVAAHPCWRGVDFARRAVALAEPKAESPMETRLRLIYVYGGMPRPQVQIEIWENGVLLYRIDMGYEELKLGFEYDGRDHADQIEADGLRRRELDDRGWALRSYFSRDVYRTPESTLREGQRLYAARSSGLVVPVSGPRSTKTTLWSPA